MRNRCDSRRPEIRDFGTKPLIIDIEQATTLNQNFLTVLWTGKNMQLTLMSIPINGDIGAEIHADVDQFIRIESGCAKVYMGNSKCDLCEKATIDSSYAVIIPAGTWHNIVNAGNRPLTLYSIYAPPQHPLATVHKAKADAECESD